MKLVPMRFKGVEWHHNPREITFTFDKTVTETPSPFGKAAVQNLGRKNRLIQGEGELYGADCTRQFRRLLELFKSGGSGVLAIPKLGTVHAVFERLTLKGMPKSDVLTYGFLFREVMEREKQDKRTVCTAQPGDTLWEISYRYGVGIDALVALNPQIKRPDEPLDGKEVALC